MAFRTLNDVEFAGRRVQIRVDVNAPVADGVVTDDTRLRAIAPTVAEVLAKGGKPILLAHFGRPKGEPVPEMSLAAIRPALEAALGAPVAVRSSAVAEDRDHASYAGQYTTVLDVHDLDAAADHGA